MIICVDWGGSLTKVVIKYVKEPHKHMEFLRFSDGFPYELVNNKINEYLITGKIEDVYVLVTGAKQGRVQKDRLQGKIVFLGEINSIGQMVKYCGYESGLVVSLGTGTPFVYNDGKEIHHVNGTGLGGGTLVGLASRLIGIDDPNEIEKLAAKGNASKVNITMSDISDGSISWLKQDYTCSNFGKLGDTKESEEDLALGIHSLVAEPIGCMAAACALGTKSTIVVFVGTLSENKIIQKILDTCLEIYGLKGVYPERSGFGTCLGAISLFEGSE